jgi:hypothetical protein
MPFLAAYPLKKGSLSRHDHSAYTTFCDHAREHRSRGLTRMLILGLRR